MSEYESVTVHEKARDEYIIDTDFHLHLPTEKLYPYIEDEFVRRKLEFGGPPPAGGLLSSVSLSYAKEKKTEQAHDRIHGTAVNREEIREVMDELALDAAVVEPGTNLELVRTNYPTVVNPLVRAYNDYVLDRIVDVDIGIYGTLMVPDWDVEFAVEELDRVGSEGGFVAAQNWTNSYKLWGDVSFDPIFDQLTELDLPLFLHIAPKEEHGPSLIRESMRTATEKNVTALGYSLMANVTNLIMTGTFDKYPDLDVVFQETGTNWIPYVAYRMDEMYQSFPKDVGLTERLHERGQETLDRMPSEYLFDNMFTATQPIAFPNIPRTDHIDGLIKACRAGETFMYTSDWPHITLDPADWLFDTPCIDEDLRAAILHGNAENVLRLPE